MLNGPSYRFRAGARLRIAIAAADTDNFLAPDAEQRRQHWALFPSLEAPKRASKWCVCGLRPRHAAAAHRLSQLPHTVASVSRARPHVSTYLTYLRAAPPRNGGVRVLGWREGGERVERGGGGQVGPPRAERAVGAGAAGGGRRAALRGRAGAGAARGGAALLLCSDAMLERRRAVSTRCCMWWWGDGADGMEPMRWCSAAALGVRACWPGISVVKWS